MVWETGKVFEFILYLKHFTPFLHSFMKTFIVTNATKKLIFSTQTWKQR